MIFPRPTVPPDSALTRITTKFLSVGKEETAGGIKKFVAGKAKEFVVTDYVCVVDESHFLHGVASLKDVLQGHDEVAVKKIMKRTL